MEKNLAAYHWQLSYHIMLVSMASVLLYWGAERSEMIWTSLKLLKGKQRLKTVNQVIYCLLSDFVISQEFSIGFKYPVSVNLFILFMLGKWYYSIVKPLSVCFIIVSPLLTKGQSGICPTFHNSICKLTVLPKRSEKCRSVYLFYKLMLDSEQFMCWPHTLIPSQF